MKKIAILFTCVLVIGILFHMTACDRTEYDNKEEEKEETRISLTSFPPDINQPSLLSTKVSPYSYTFPEWSYNLHLWPFDILYPDTSEKEIRDRLEDAVSAGANSVIVYIEEEHMYGTFVDQAGFDHMLDLLTTLTDAAHSRNLHVIVYLNGLEVMTHNAVNPDTCRTLPTDTMARVHPDWLQMDLNRQSIVFTCLDMDWVTTDMEDAWVSPFSPYRDLFKNRLASLGSAEVDAVYIDATFMPGLQSNGDELIWGTTDPLARERFQIETGYETPTEADWDDPAWRSWLLWRHDVIQEYLGDLAIAAWNAGMVPFWESSSNDNIESVYLANETAFTAFNPMGFSPEIEPEGDWLAAFRMAQSARDFAPDHPMIYLGWPENAKAAKHEFATTLSFSNNLYPTSDAPYPIDAFDFVDSIQSEILDQRQPFWGHVALIYSVRNKDWTFETGEHFEAYDDIFRDMTMNHIPFRILVLESLTSDDLQPFDTVILPNLISISDSEYDLLRNKNVVIMDWETGLRDENWALRDSQLEWPKIFDAEIEDLPTGLPFRIESPETTFIAYYSIGTGGYSMFATHSIERGEIVLNADKPFTVKAYRRGHPVEELSGKKVVLSIQGELTVLQIIFTVE